MTDNEIISLLWKVENGHILTNHEQEMLYKKKHLNWSVDEEQNPSIPESIICLRNLESLSVRDTGIYMLPESIGMLKNLKYLNLQNTYISKLPITFRNLNKLITLNLRGTKISTLDGIIGNFDNLQNLDLSETSITKLPDEIANLKNLRQLSLRDTLIVDLPQCVGELDKLHVLNLWNTQINELPDSIKRLTRLQTLDLRQTKIRELPYWIDCLKNLRKLRLWSTQISEFPEEIGNLEQLSSLDFSRTQVKELPDTLKNLTNLQKLHFNNTQIAELPSSIRELKNLRFLNLSRTQVSELPDFLGQLSNLQSLNIAATPINELPDTIGKLTSLESLNLKKTQITELPEFLKNLRNLRMLGLGELPLKKLPNWIVNFKHLRELYIWKTNISELPEWITELNNLRGLDVSCTSISVLPESLYKLSKLRYLDLSNTLISSLPNSIGTLSNLKWLILEKLTLIELPESLLYLHLNYVNEKYQQPKITGIFINELKLKKQPISLFYQNRGLIIDYYRQNHLDINETKIIFLGDEGVGKTHTIKRILNNNHKIVEPLSETPGISITSKDFFTDKISYRINFWDFGGQEIMHAMHRCFLTDRTGYVVVVSTRFGDLNKQARYWLKNIDSFTKNAPIVIYVNIWNDGTLYELNQSSLRKDYPNIVTIKQCSAKDDDDISFSAITNAIQNMALTNDSISMSFPSSWENIRQRIIDIGKKEPKRYYISQKDFRNECYKNGIIDEGIQTWLLNWFNDLGECFSYQFEECMVTNQDLKILNPEWLTNAIYIIIREAGDLAINGFVSHKGIRNKLDHSDKGTLKDVSYTAAECNYILEIMRKFRLSYKVSGQDIEFIPALLRDNTPSDLDFNSEAISYEMRYENLPENVIHNLMIMMYPYLDYQKCWRKGAVIDIRNILNIGLLATLDMSRDDEILHIKVFSFANHAPYELLQEIRTHLLDINYNMNLKAEDYIIIDSVTNKEEVSVDKLLKLKARNVDFYQGSDQDFDINTLLGDVFGSEQVKKVNTIGHSGNDDTGLNAIENLADDYWLASMRRALQQPREKQLLRSISYSPITCNDVCSNLISACLQIQGNSLYWNANEDSRSTQVRDILRNRGQIVSDQTLYGHAMNSRHPGEIDLMIMKNTIDPLTIIEAMNIDSVNKGYIYDHLKKLVDDYNPSGLRELFLVAYVKKSKNHFQSFWNNYISFISETSAGDFHFKTIEEKDTGNHYIKHAIVQYDCDGALFSVHHICMRAGD